MDLTKESKQRKEFRDILFELAKSQELLQDAYYRSNMYKRLESLYDAESSEKRFRHFYTDIFSVLTQIQQNSELGDINILGQNLDVIRNGYKPQNKASDGKRIILQSQINSLQKELQKAKNIKADYEDTEKKIVEVEAKLDNSQKEYITILGIFAAVVLAFTGGISFSTSVLTEPLPAKAGRFGLLLKQPKVVAASLISFST